MDVDAPAIAPRKSPVWRPEDCSRTSCLGGLLSATTMDVHEVKNRATDLCIVIRVCQPSRIPRGLSSLPLPANEQQGIPPCIS